MVVEINSSRASRSTAASQVPVVQEPEPTCSSSSAKEHEKAPVIVQSPLMETVPSLPETSHLAIPTSTVSKLVSVDEQPFSPEDDEAMLSSTPLSDQPSRRSLEQ